jgi:hypothetical protein
MVRRRNALLIFPLICLALILIIIGTYSTLQVRAGKKIGLFQTPEECMYALIAREYTGIQRIEIARMDRAVFDRIRFIKVYVYAAGRRDGLSLPEPGYGQENRVFVKTGGGWTVVRKDRFLTIIALGQWLLSPLAS